MLIIFNGLVEDGKESISLDELLDGSEKVLQPLFEPLSLDSDTDALDSVPLSASSGSFSFLSGRNAAGKPVKFLKNTGALEAKLPHDHDEQGKSRRFATPIHRILENVENKVSPTFQALKGLHA